MRSICISRRRLEHAIGDAVVAGDAAVLRTDRDVQVVEARVPPDAAGRVERAAQRVGVRCLRRVARARRQRVRLRELWVRGILRAQRRDGCPLIARRSRDGERQTSAHEQLHSSIGVSATADGVRESTSRSVRSLGRPGGARLPAVSTGRDGGRRSPRRGACLSEVRRSFGLWYMLHPFVTTRPAHTGRLRALPLSIAAHIVVILVIIAPRARTSSSAGDIRRPERASRACSIRQGRAGAGRAAVAARAAPRRTRDSCGRRPR